MNTIVNEELISFKELEQKVFGYACEVAREITCQILEAYDKELAEARDKKKYRGKADTQNVPNQSYQRFE